MNRNVLTTIPREVAWLTFETAANAGGLALTLAREARERRQPDYIPTDEQRTQAALRQDEVTVGMLDIMERGITAHEIGVRASWAAYNLVDRGVVDEDTHVELRVVEPGDALAKEKDELVDQGGEAMKSLKYALGDYGITAVYSVALISPTKQRYSRATPAEVWGHVAPEVSGMAHQMAGGSAKSAVMLGITDTEYLQRILGSQLVTVDPADPITSHHADTWVLERAGERPEGNILLGGVRGGILEARELQQLG